MVKNISKTVFEFCYSPKLVKIHIQPKINFIHFGPIIFNYYVMYVVLKLGIKFSRWINIHIY